jgi:hypothetical protein
MPSLPQYEHQTYLALGHLLPPEITNIIAKYRFQSFQARISSFNNPLQRPGVYETMCVWVTVKECKHTACFSPNGTPLFSYRFYNRQWFLRKNEWVESDYFHL